MRAKFRRWVYMEGKKIDLNWQLELDDFVYPLIGNRLFRMLNSVLRQEWRLSRMSKSVVWRGIAKSSHESSRKAPFECL